jgi:hypothetical protein
MNNNAARNPFIYGGMVSGETFCDREAEIAELMEDIRSKQHVIVFSQRRKGVGVSCLHSEMSADLLDMS